MFFYLYICGIASIWIFHRRARLGNWVRAIWCSWWRVRERSRTSTSLKSRVIRPFPRPHVSPPSLQPPRSSLSQSTPPPGSRLSLYARISTRHSNSVQRCCPIVSIRRLIEFLKFFISLLLMQRCQITLFATGFGLTNHPQIVKKKLQNRMQGGRP